jgi:hypothetical protein
MLYLNNKKCKILYFFNVIILFGPSGNWITYFKPRDVDLYFRSSIRLHGAVHKDNFTFLSAPFTDYSKRVVSERKTWSIFTDLNHKCETRTPKAFNFSF